MTEKISQVQVFIPPKVKTKPKKAPPKRVDNERITHLSTSEEDMVFVVGASTWVLKNSGELAISTGKHWFSCTWSLTGSIYAVLYESLPWHEKKLKQILSQVSTIEWLKAHSKRTLPPEWYIEKS